MSLGWFVPRLLVVPEWPVNHSDNKCCIACAQQSHVLSVKVTITYTIYYDFL